MQISEKLVNDVVVIEIKGKILMGKDIEIKKKINELVERKALSIVVNLAQVPYIDSSGLGELASSHSSIYNLGGQIKLAGLNEKVRRLVEISMLHTVFEIFKSEEDALRSFRDPVRRA